MPSSSINLKKDDDLFSSGIQLNERQREMMKARKQGRHMLPTKQMATSPGPQPLQKPQRGNADMQKLQKLVLAHGKGNSSKQKQVRTVGASSSSVDDERYWAHQPTNTVETVPTTWSESAESAAGASSAASSSHSTALSFYGQRLDENEKKLYDDTGATWNDSRSNVTTSTAVQSRMSSAHVSLSKASATARSSHRLSAESASSQQQQQQLVEKDTPSVQLAESNSIAASSMYDQQKDAASIQHDDTMRTELESDESLAPVDSRSESIAKMEPHHRPPPQQEDVEATAQPNAKNSFRDKFKRKTKVADSLKISATTLVKNLVGGSARKPKSPKSPKQDFQKEAVEEAASNVSTRSSEQGSRKGLLARAIRSPRSSATGSSIPQHEKG